VDAKEGKKGRRGKEDHFVPRSWCTFSLTNWCAFSLTFARVLKLPEEKRQKNETQNPDRELYIFAPSQLSIFRLTFAKPDRDIAPVP
jgi:hypothetical protein